MKRRPPRIRGAAGGGDQSSKPPVEADDSLKSAAFVRVLDLLCEGEIHGLVDGAESIYLNETPLENSNGTRNFKGVTYETRQGTQNQTYIEGAGGVESETSVGVELKKGTVGLPGDVIRQITNPDITRLRVRFMIPQLTKTDKNTGDILGTSVAVQVYVQPDGGSYSLVKSRTVSGKSSGRYQFTLDFALTGSAPWNVKIVRTTADSEDQRLQNKTYVDAIVEVIEAKLRYPNSAYVALRIDSESFDSVPTRFFDVKLLKIRIPSNASVRSDGSLTYSGSWDGTFQTAWSANPAWVFYDLLTADRYGLGAFLPDDQVDKWSLFTIGQYCDELVPDGFGGTEPRFTCNMLLQDRAEAYTVIQNLASVFRGMAYWAAGSVFATQDSPQDAAYLYTQANVLDGRFSYQGASAKARHTVVLVSWNDPEDFYRTKIEYVEDQAGIALYGVQTTEVIAMGCTSRGQANRLGRWLLYTEQNESETVSFKTGLEGAIARPGQIIKVADLAKAGVSLGGRVVSGTTTHVTIDRDVSGSLSGNMLSVLLTTGEVEERTVVGSSGRVVAVQPAFSSAPQSHAVWLLKSTSVEPQTFRVISIKEEEGGATFAITALRHNPDKYDAVEQDVVLETRSYSALTLVPNSPSSQTVEEALYLQGLDVKVRVRVSWDRVDRAVGYLVRYKRDDENFVDLPETSFNQVDILDANPGFYTIEITALNSFGKPSVPTVVVKEVLGKTIPPAQITGFSMLPVAGSAYLTWDPSADLDVLVGGKIRIRHSPLTSGQDWKDAVDILPTIPGSATNATAPLLSGTYMIKAVDSSGNIAEDASLIVTTVPHALALNVVETQTEDPLFAGEKTAMILDAGEDALVLDSGVMVDDYGLIDDLSSWDLPYGLAPEGFYDFENTIDLGGVWPFRVISRLEVEAFDIGNLIDVREDPIDEWQDIDGELIDDVNAEIQIRTTEDDPSGSPEWTEWKRIAMGEYLARGIQHRLRVTTESELHNIWVRGLEVTVDMADRAFSSGLLTSGAGTYSVAYGEAFFNTPTPAITATNLSSGDYWQISNPTESGFDIVFRNAAGSAVSRNFYVVSKGYGRKVA